MERQVILESIAAERDRQDKMWGNDFDAKNTVNDWVAYITRYVSEGAYDGSSQKFDEKKFREYLMKAATLCVAALEQESFAPRHYDGSRAAEGEER
jgi:hypothetical protein